MNKKQILSLLLFSISFNLSAESLEQAVSKAIVSSPKIRSAYNDYMSFYYDHKSSVGGYRPTIDLSAATGYEVIDEDHGKDTDLYGNEIALNIKQILWDGGYTSNNISRTAAEAESMRLQLISDASDLALEVSKAYLDVVQATEVLGLSEQNLKDHVQIRLDIQRKFDSGMSSKADLSQVNARLSKASANFISAQNNLFDKKVIYKSLVGDDFNELVYPRVDKNFIPENIEEAMDLAFENHTVVKIALVDIDSALYQYNQSKSKNYPTLSLDASHSWKEDISGVEGTRDETSIMLRLNYNLYNGNSDSNDTKNYGHQVNKAKDLRDNVYRELEQSIRLSWNALQSIKEQKLSLSENVDFVSDTLIAYKKQYQLGQRSLLDLLNSENELLDARISYLTADFSLQYAKYRVLNGTGKLLDSLRVDTAKEWHEEVYLSE